MDLGDDQSAMNFIDGDSEYVANENDLSMGQIRENDDEMNNSMDGKRTTFHTKRPRSLGGFEDEEDEDTPGRGGDLMSLGKTQKGDNTQAVERKKAKVSGEINVAPTQKKHIQL